MPWPALPQALRATGAPVVALGGQVQLFAETVLACSSSSSCSRRAIDAEPATAETK